MSVSAATSRRESRDRIVAAWLALAAALVFGMIILGGLTRLTDSGLSITQWALVTGALPPLSDADWQEAFARYRAIPEYTLQNQGMSLAEFKTIFWWEWSHRFLGRFLGVVFLVPLVVFLWRGWLHRRLRPRLAVLFVLGALQGLVGWWMVASGLSERVDVSQYRLAVHLGLAFALFAALIWTAADAAEGPRQAQRWTPASRLAAVFAGLVFLQIIAGALVAGLDAGRIFTTWPLMEGRIAPAGYGALEPFWRNVFDNRAAVQFNHRMLGYGVAVFGLGFAWAQRGSPERMWALGLGAIVCVQVILGVWTLTAGAPLALSSLHQAGAAGLFATAVLLTRSLRRQGRSPAAD